MEVTKSARPKLRNPYPAIDFGDAYRYLWKLRRVSPERSSFNRAELLKDLGFSEKNVVGDNVIGSLAHYGLVYRIDGKKVGQPGSSSYRVTEEAIALVESESDWQKWRELARKHATYPELFHYLFERYGESLPQDIAVDLIGKYQLVTSKNVGKITWRYARSLAFVREEGEKQPVGDLDTEPEQNTPTEIYLDMGDGIKTVLPISSLPKILKWYWSHPHPEDSRQKREVD